MESLQLAQMLADISDLSAADKKAAAAIVNANKTLPTNPQAQNDHLKAAAATSSSSRPSPTTSATRFDKFGRKILTPPAMSRTNSTGPTSRDGSTPGTPRASELIDDDVHHANTLMTLYEIRNRLKQQDNTGLKKAREQIDALIAKNKQQQQQTQGQAQLDVQNTERPRPMSRTYTYPKTGPSSTTETK